MASESIHQKLERVRRPHVHIKYEVETGGAVEVKELPFVMGVMGDFSGDGLAELEPLRDRKFKDINRDNFNQVLSSLKPSLNLRVANELGEDDSQELSVALKFENMDDFTPGGVARQVPQLQRLLDMRDQINQLKNQIDRSPKLEQELDAILKDPSLRAALAKELGIDDDKNS